MTAAERANEALRLTYGLVHACREPLDVRLWHALIQLAPRGVVLKAARELTRDRVRENEGGAAAHSAAASNKKTRRIQIQGLIGSHFCPNIS